MRQKSLNIIAVCSALAALHSGAASAAYLYADPTGWTSLSVGGGSATQSWKGTNDLTVSVLNNADAGLTLGTQTLNFPSSSPSNPEWIAGSRSFLNVAYDDITGTDDDVTFQFEFATSLSPQDYMVFADFDFGEEIYVNAYDASNNLIPFSAFTFQKENGLASGGSTYANINFLDGSPYSSSVHLQSPGTSSSSNPVVTLQSATPISRLEYSFVMDSQGLSVGSNSIRVNFATAVPEPGTLAMLMTGLTLLAARKANRRVTR